MGNDEHTHDEGLHQHNHFESHEHHHHDHWTLSSNQLIWPFIVSGVLLLVFLVMELTIGIIGHSLALISDSLHMLIDAATAFISAWVITLLKKPESDAFTFGFKRADVMMAEGQGVLFIVTGATTALEAIQHLIHPSEVRGQLVIIAAAVGIVMSFIIFWITKMSGKSMTSESGIMHAIQDMAGFGSTLVAGILISITHFNRWDSIAALVVAFLMFKHAYEMLKKSGRILLESTPEDVDLEKIRDFIEDHPVSPKVRNLHVWSISSEIKTMSVHIILEDDVDCHPIQTELRKYAQKEFGITHVTIETLHPSDLLGNDSPAHHS